MANVAAKRGRSTNALVKFVSPALGCFSQIHVPSARNPQRSLRLPRVQRTAGRNCRARRRRRRLSRADADGRRQVAVLSDSVAGAARRRFRHRHRGVAADRADAGSGGRAHRSRRACGVSELDAVERGGDGHRACVARRRNRSAVCGAGTSDDAAFPGVARSVRASVFSRSTKRIACRNGGTISGPNTFSCRCCTSAFRTCRASRSPPPRTRSRATKSSIVSRSTTRAFSYRASIGRTSAIASSKRTMRVRSCSTSFAPSIRSRTARPTPAWSIACRVARSKRRRSG